MKGPDRRRSWGYWSVCHEASVEQRVLRCTRELEKCGGARAAFRGARSFPRREVGASLHSTPAPESPSAPSALLTLHPDLTTTPSSGSGSGTDHGPPPSSSLTALSILSVTSSGSGTEEGAARSVPAGRCLPARRSVTPARLARPAPASGSSGAPTL